MNSIVFSFSLIFLLDFFSYGLTSFLTKQKPHHNSRWFFMHFIVNSIVTIYTFEDFKYCLKNYNSCPLTDISNDSYFATQLVILLHIYHLIVFNKYLKEDDWIHHITMCIFNGGVFYYQKKKIQAVTAFFCSGLPGMIDYYLLYLVKIKYLDKKFEKNIYLFLTTYIRSPGCVLTTLLAVPYFLEKQTNLDYLISLISIGLVFWNGQYYMKKTCIDYGKKYNY